MLTYDQMDKLIEKFKSNKKFEVIQFEVCRPFSPDDSITFYRTSYFEGYIVQGYTPFRVEFIKSKTSQYELSKYVRSFYGRNYEMNGKERRVINYWMRKYLMEIFDAQTD